MPRRFCVLFVTCGWMFLQAQAPENTKLSVAGTVVNSATGQPISGALVIMRAQPQIVPGQPPRPSESERAVTDSSGRFSFEADKAAGASLQVSRQGYRSDNNNLDVAMVFVGPQDPGHTTVRLVPQSVVTGRIVNGDGDPLYGLTVEAVRIDIVDGRRQIKDHFASSVSDDRGEYRLWNLQPGSYYIKVAGRRATYNNSATTITFELSQEAYGPVYYPSASEQENAQILRIQPGQTINAPFQLEGRHAYQIRGKVSNAPAGRALLVRLLRGADILANSAGVNMVTGTFQVADATPGSYTLQIYTASGLPAWVAEAPVNVGDSDLTGVALAMTSGSDVHVKYDFTGYPKALPMLIARRVDSLAPPGAAREVMALVDQTDPQTNSFKGLLPGRYAISVSGDGGDQYVSSIRAGATDLLAEDLVVTGAGTPDLTLSMAPGAGSIMGTIDAGSRTAPARNLGIPDFGGEQRTLLLVGRRGIPQTYRVDPMFREEFEVSGLAPGEYALYVLPEGHEIEFRNPAVLSLLSQYAVSVKVGSGETKDVTLKPIPPEAVP